LNGGVPEGDSIHRLADRLRPVLAGQPLVRLEAPRAAATARRPPPGTLVADVEAVGKHLLIRFADGAILRTHLRMTGSWHLYRTGERWRRPAHLARAVVEVPGWVAVCFSAPVVSLEHERSRDRGTAHLGPDLTSADLTDADLDACLHRMATLVEPDEEIGTVLLDQRIACGVGNVFKAEVLWACGVDPFAPVVTIDESTRRQLLATAARLLRANAARSGPRVTHGDGVAVYGRQGRACPRCGSVIRVRRQGQQARSTYWCPRCQRGPSEEVDR
jgi:endonuclease-8